VDQEEAEWLDALARGATVVSLADDYGYSERVMFRRLRDLYERLGASKPLRGPDQRGALRLAAQRRLSGARPGPALPPAPFVFPPLWGRKRAAAR